MYQCAFACVHQYRCVHPCPETDMIDSTGWESVLEKEALFFSMSEIVEMDGNDNNAEASRASRNPKSRKLRSLVWNDFTKEQKADGTYIAVCNHCKKELTASSRSGTTHLKNHLGVCMSSKRIKRRKLVVRRLALKSGEPKNDGNGTLDRFQFDQELSRQDLARMIVLHGYPFAIVQHPGFQTFIKNLQPQFKLVRYEDIRADCMKIYDTVGLKLHEVLEKLPYRVSLTVDMWKSNEDVEYLCLTCHYVDDDWKFQRKILNFLHVESPLTAEEISKAIVEKLCYWNIDRKLFTVVLDNCSFDDVVANEVLSFLRTKGFHQSNDDLFHVHSCAHILNLIVQEGLDPVSALVNKVRDSVECVKSSPGRMEKFQKVTKQVGAQQKLVVCDTPVSWSSACLMLKAAYAFQDAFIWLAENDAEFANFPSSQEWVEVKAVIECFEDCFGIINKCSGTRIPTANLYFNDIYGFQELVKTWCIAAHPIVQSMASHMLDKFEYNWGITRTVMEIASILDPRYKLKSAEYFVKQLYGDTYEAKTRIDAIRQRLESIYDDYAVRSTHTSRNQALLLYYRPSSGCTSNDCGVTEESKPSSRITLSDTRRGLDQYLQKTSSSQSTKTDLSMYLEEAVFSSKEGHEDFNILAWWKFNAAKYPILSVMARDFLAIPVSIVALDTEGRVLNQYLSSMDPTTVQALICAQDWLREDMEAAVILDGDSSMSLVPANMDELSPLSK